MEVPRSDIDSEAAVSELPMDSPCLRFFLLQERLELRRGVGERMLLVAGFRLGESESESGPAKALVSSAYDPASDCWYELPLGRGLELPPWTGPTTREEENSKTTLFVELPRASMSPGVLLAKLCPGKLVLHIGNPVAGSWATLPPKYKMRTCHVRGVFVDTVARRFQLVVVRDRERNFHPGQPQPAPRHHTLVFDSAFGFWTRFSALIPEGDDFRRSSGQGVFIGTVLYCLTEECDLLVYSLEWAASWDLLVVGKRDVPFIPRNPATYELFSVGGRLLCAAIDGYMQIWEVELDMDLEAPAWKVVASMPAPMCTEFRGEWRVNFIGRRYSVVAGQDVVYIMRERLDKVKIAAVDFRSTPPAWRLLPDLPYNGFTRKSFHCLDPFGSWEQSL